VANGRIPIQALVAQLDARDTVNANANAATSHS